MLVIRALCKSLDDFCMLLNVRRGQLDTVSADSPCYVGVLQRSVFKPSTNLRTTPNAKRAGWPLLEKHELTDAELERFAHYPNGNVGISVSQLQWARKVVATNLLS